MSGWSRYAASDDLNNLGFLLLYSADMCSNWCLLSECLARSVNQFFYLYVLDFKG